MCRHSLVSLLLGCVITNNNLNIWPICECSFRIYDCVSILLFIDYYSHFLLTIALCVSVIMPYESNYKLKRDVENIAIEQSMSDFRSS